MNKMSVEMPLFEERDGDIVPPEQLDIAIDERFSEVDFEYNADNAEMVEFRQRGIAVSLADRALALEWIMDYFNKANRANGLSHAAVTQPAAADIEQRYGDATPDVVSGASQKVLDRRQLFTRHLETLVGAAALRQSGMDEDEVRLKVTTLQSELNQQFGVGNAYAKDRYRAVRTVRKSTDKIIKK